MDGLMVGILGGQASDMDIEVHDGEILTDASVMYDPDFSSGATSGRASLFHTTERIEIAGHYWTVTVRSLDGFETRLDGGKPLFITYAGGIASALLFLFAWLLIYGRTRALRDASEIERSETRLSNIINTALDAVVQMDSDGRISGWNNRAETIFGWQREQAIGRLLHETIIPPQHRQAHIMGMKHFLESGHGPVLNSRFEITALHKDGHEFPIELSITQFKVANQNLFTSFIRDITERKLAEEELQLAAMVYESSSEAMAVTDASNRIIAVNPSFEKLTGYDEHEVLGKDPRILSSGRQDRTFYQAMWHDIKTLGYWQGELWDKRKNGDIYPKSLTINTIKGSDGEIHRYVALFSDITKKKESEELIWKQANFDMLTALPNRRMFRDRLDQEIKKAHRSGLPLALMLLDLDRFKEINDTLGHDMGDVLLKEAAFRLSACVRESDTVARLGGDEFTIILSELDDPASVDRIARDIMQKLAEPFCLGDETGYVSTSIGITLYPDDATEIDSLLKNADQAMYAAKNQGRNRSSYFTPSMQQNAQARMRMVSDLRNAVLAADQFLLHYQPIVELASGAIHKAEALIRWQHPVHGLISPDQFIPIAEETGLIVEIGDWVFHQAAAQAVRWRAMHDPEFQLSINKSPVQFRDMSGTHSAWFEHLQALGLPGSSITVEITEGLLLDANTSIADQLLAFRDAGVQVAIDDFGTGYSSLSYLKRFDIDYLKIDQAFVRNLKADSDDLALCEAIIVMAHRLDIKVIAEGIETEEQCGLLLAAGCDYGQGYLFSRPIPAAAFDAFLSEQPRKIDRAHP
ncbi:MAG: EAL domain-containing protein [Nitrosomonadales bacterium]|nr:EAL domain-containing protein [Nitrosomonadales bacterium]